MAFYRMPSLGADMEQGQLVEWLVEPGQEVPAGSVVAVVETQKGAIEIEVFEPTRFLELLAAPGAVVPVGKELARIAGPEEAEAAPARPETAAPAADTRAPEPEPSQPATSQTVPSQPPPAGSLRPRATPAARRLARERGIDLAAIHGSGIGGAIQSADIPAAAGATVAGVAPPAGPAAGRGLDFGEMRKAIAAAMARSKREIPHYYLSHTFSVEPLKAWLEHANAQRAPEERLLPAVAFLKALALALHSYPEFNGHFIDGAFAPSKSIHVGMAISIRGGGLIAPAIHDIDQLSLAEIMTKVRDLAARSRTGRLRGSELTDATITLSNLGERGVGQLFGVIYPPQVALIGLGRQEERAWAVGGGVAVKPVVTVTLSGDHRANDGHRGALLLRELERGLEEPDTL